MVVKGQRLTEGWCSGWSQSVSVIHIIVIVYYA